LFDKQLNSITSDNYHIIGSLFSLLSTIPDIFNLIINLNLNRKFLEESKIKFRPSSSRTNRQSKNISQDTTSVRKQTCSSLGKSFYTIVNSNTDYNISKGLYAVNRQNRNLENFRIVNKQASAHFAVISKRRASSMNIQYIISKRRSSMFLDVKGNHPIRRSSLFC
jgi:hypothetical protein